MTASDVIARRILTLIPNVYYKGHRLGPVIPWAVPSDRVNYHRD